MHSDSQVREKLFSRLAVILRESYIETLGSYKGILGIRWLEWEERRLGGAKPL